MGHEVVGALEAGHSETSRLKPVVPVRCLLLDAGDRRIRDIDMAPLLTGEFKLLSYLGSCPWTWHSTDDLAWEVYGRRDPAAHQLVWTYASLLRKKVASELPQLIAVCRRRGYSCQQPVKLVDAGATDARVRAHPRSGEALSGK
jgi:DNA-binding response OmpR family regulator